MRRPTDTAVAKGAPLGAKRPLGRFDDLEHVDIALDDVAVGTQPI
jgi:hypothetical protein